MLPRRGLRALIGGVYLGAAALVSSGMRSPAPFLVALAAAACAPSEDPGLCEGIPGQAVELSVSYRFEDSPLEEGDSLPVFVPPQGGIATEVDVGLGGVGLDTVEALRLEITRTSGVSVAAVTYSGGGLPLECVQDGELRVRGVPVPFADGLTLEALEGAEVQVVGTLVRTDGGTAEFVSAVRLDSATY